MSVSGNERRERDELSEEEVKGVLESSGRTKNSQITKRETAHYINELAVEMKILAEGASFNFLAYLLDLVIEESGVQKRGGF